MLGIGIGRHDLAGRARNLCNLRNNVSRQKPFAVVFKDNRVCLRNGVSDRREHMLDLVYRWPGKLFTIDANNLLMTRNDARFHNRAERLVFNRVGEIDFLFCQQFLKLLATAIVSQQADDRDVIYEFAQIACDVGSASGVERLSGDLHNRNRRLGGNAADFSPHEFIEHQIADDQYSLCWRTIQDRLESVRVHKSAEDAAEAAQWFDYGKENILDGVCARGWFC